MANDDRRVGGWTCCAVPARGGSWTARARADHKQRGCAPIVGRSPKRSKATRQRTRRRLQGAETAPLHHVRVLEVECRPFLIVPLEVWTVRPSSISRLPFTFDRRWMTRYSQLIRSRVSYPLRKSNYHAGLPAI